MFYIDDIKISPNPVEVKGQLDIEVALHEESAGAKRYPGRYGYRYAQVDKRRRIYASGKNITINSEKSYILYEDIIFGKSIQNGVPSPDNPVEVISIKDSITQKFTDTKSQTQTLTIPLLDELRGIKVQSGGNYTDETGQQWLCDSIEVYSDGTSKIIQRIKKYTYTGDETFTLNTVWDSSEPQYIHAYSLFSDKKQSASISGQGMMCNYFECELIASSGKLNTNIVYANFINNAIYFFLEKSRLETPDIIGLKKWLKTKKETGNPVEILYPLQNPIETPLSDEIVQKFKQIKMYQPITNIYTLENAEQKITCLAER